MSELRVSVFVVWMCWYRKANVESCLMARLSSERERGSKMDFSMWFAQEARMRAMNKMAGVFIA